ncbi:phosphopantetheine-binding protein [Streptomyces sp. NPDC041068]|uniref:phosphopantetheine-binding protein n=1 Tax=Streptomyces sp. NPDC041068 TaxID=3155130 RepID=UPI0033ED9BFC
MTERAPLGTSGHPGAPVVPDVVEVPEPAVHAELLDCLQANLALLADRYHGAGTHLRLGARLRFAPRPGEGALPSTEPTLADHLADAEDLLGLVATDHRQRVPGAELAAVTEPVYVVADAYHLPWVPYHGTKHVEHSFLVGPDGDGPDGDGLAIEDAYHNDTQWGRARPQRLRYGRAELAALVDSLPEGAEVVWLNPKPPGPAPEPVALGAEPADDYARRCEDYVRRFTEHPDRVEALDRFTLETWLLARARRLHARYRFDGTELPPSVAEHLARWDSVVEHAYLAYRRVARGRAEPPELLARAADALRADTELFAAAPSPAPSAGPGDGDDAQALHAAVRAVVASVLGTAPELLPDDDLTALPAFTSLRMVEIVEQLETSYEVEFAPSDLVPEKLHRLADLTELVRRAQRDA